MKNLKGIEAGMMVGALLVACNGESSPMPAIPPTRPVEVQNLAFTDVFLFEGGSITVCSTVNKRNGGTFVREDGGIVYFLRVGPFRNELTFVEERLIEVDDGLFVYDGQKDNGGDPFEDVVYYDMRKWTENCPPRSSRGVEAGQFSPDGIIFSI